MKIRASLVTLVAGFTIGLALGGLTQWTEYLDDPAVKLLLEETLVMTGDFQDLPPAGFRFLKCESCQAMTRMFFNAPGPLRMALSFDAVATKIIRDSGIFEDEMPAGPEEPDDPELDL
jgi:hypothetical protein